MAVVPDTTTGTITITSGSASFTTSGTNMLTRGHLPGDTVHRNGFVLVIATITGENSGTFTENAPAAMAGTGVAVRIRFQPDGSRVNAQARNLIDTVNLFAARIPEADASNPSKIYLYEATANGTNKLTISPAASLTADRVLTTPDADVAISAFIATLLDDADAATARTTLGITASAIGVREKLVANRTYYFRSDGSDSNTGLANTSGGAFLTAQKAFDVISGSLDLDGFTVTVQRGDAVDYTSAITIKSWVGGGAVVLDGNGRTFNTTNATVLATTGVLSGSFTYQNMKLQTTTGGLGLYHGATGTVYQGASVTFNACASDHIQVAGSGAVWQALAAYTIAGSAPFHIRTYNGALAFMDGRTITVTGTPAFSSAFVMAQQFSMIQAISVTFSGSATGTRYIVGLNAVINTGGGGASYFPGNSAGSTATGGQYA